MAKQRTRTDHWHDPDAPRPTSRKPSASVFVEDDIGRVLLLRRADNGLWTIPTGGVKFGETVAEAGVRECHEETGIVVEVTGTGRQSGRDHVQVAEDDALAVSAFVWLSRDASAHGAGR